MISPGCPRTNLTIAGAFSFVDSEITRHQSHSLEGISVPVGSELPFTPDFSGSLRARYDFDLPINGGSECAYISAGLSYTGESKSGIAGSAFRR